MTLKQRIANFILGEEKARLEVATQRLYEAYLEGPYLRSPEQLLVELQEVDSSLLQDLVNQMGYDIIGGVGFGSSEPTESERLRSVDESRRLYRYDVVSQWIIWVWTNFGFGQTISVVPEDESALEIWNEFWDADRNQRILAEDEQHALSEDLLVDGEKFLLLFISTLDGKVTLREMDTKEVTEIIYHPDDKAVRLFYKRAWTDPRGTYREMYYPDWLALLTEELDKDYQDPFTGERKRVTDTLPIGAIRADQVAQETLVCCLHMAHNRKGGERGWPLMSAAAPWSRAHKKFREDRTAVASAVAMFVRKIKVQGGSRAVDAMKARFASTLSYGNSIEGNPPPVAGSTWVENQSADMSSMPLSTGAGDAKSDGEALLTMAGLGGGVYPHWIGAGDAYRLATATSMEAPMYREFSRYQRFWGAQFRKMVRVVLWAAETYGNAHFTTYQASVSTDKLLQVDVPQLVSSLSNSVGSLLTPFADKIPESTLKKILSASWRLILQALEVSDADTLTSEEAFGIINQPSQKVVTPQEEPSLPEVTPPPEEATSEEKVAFVWSTLLQVKGAMSELRERVSEGGPGSGNFGHSGILGQRRESSGGMGGFTESIPIEEAQ